VLAAVMQMVYYRFWRDHNDILVAVKAKLFQYSFDLQPLL